jgi:hypothetical protein
MRIARPTLPLVTVALSLALSASAARAGWGPDGSTLLATPSILRPLAAAPDGSHGTFVIWQEEQAGSTTGTLRAQHVLATGDPDPAWPAAGTAVSDAVAGRQALGALPDRLGGVYVWWMEGQRFYLNRLDALGNLAQGWPARGRSFGAISSSSPRPSVIEDGAHGVYAAWIAATLIPEDPVSVLAVHLGPGNTGAGGWSNNPRGISPATLVATIESWPKLALATDGGVFVGWASASVDSPAVPSAWRLRRLTSAGINAAGWPSEGLALAPFAASLMVEPHPSSAFDLAPDGRGGVFALLGDPVGYDGWATWVEWRLRRITGDGTTAAGWPEAGRQVPVGGSAGYIDFGPDATALVRPDGLDGAIACTIWLYDHGSALGCLSCDEGGQWGNGLGGALGRSSLIPVGGGAYYLADYNCDGPLHPYDEIAYIRAAREPVAPGAVYEWHDQPAQFWYGGAAIASTEDGGAVFFWSQAHERFGLFARRLTPGGQLLDTPESITGGLALGRTRFVPGQGVQASIPVPAGGATLELYDVGGRRLARQRLAPGTGPDVVLAGTRDLAAGLYLVRVSGAGAIRTGRVVVAR